MTYILFVWTIVAATKTNADAVMHRDWRPMGEFQTVEACQRASVVLKVGSRAQCVPTAPRQAVKTGAAA
jgi:hypothetical protein